MFATTIRFTMPADTKLGSAPAARDPPSLRVYRMIPLRSKAFVFAPERSEFGGNYVCRRRTTPRRSLPPRRGGRGVPVRRAARGARRGLRLRGERGPRLPAGVRGEVPRFTGRVHLASPGHA